jgi:uncharacterized membrane protein
MFKRIAAGILGVIHAANGLVMLTHGHQWFERIAARTGPFNPHFVADVGAAFLASGLALLWRSWRSRYWPGAVAGCGFLLFHATIHISDYVAHGQEGQSTLLIVLLAALALWAALPSSGENRA